MQRPRVGHALREITGHALVKRRSRFGEITGHDAVKYPLREIPLSDSTPVVPSTAPVEAVPPPVADAAQAEATDASPPAQAIVGEDSAAGGGIARLHGSPPLYLKAYSSVSASKAELPTT